MKTSEPKNKKISASSDSCRSFLEEFGSGVFASSGPYDPFLLGSLNQSAGSYFLDIREIILEKNKTQIDGFSTQENCLCITAIVPCNLSGDKNTLFDQCGHVFGSAKKPSFETCGKVRAKVMCSEEYNHEYYYKHERCNHPDCPSCYSKFAHKLADRVVERVRGYMSVYPDDLISHVVFWPEYTAAGYLNMTEAFDDARRMLVKMGSVSSVVWYHPYRIRNNVKEKLRRYRRKHRLPDSIGFWQMAHDDVLGLGGLEPYVEYGPHFHALSTGYLMASDEYAKLGMGGYKKVRRVLSVSEFERICYYLSTHACWELGHQAVRYYGKISTSKLAKGYPRETIVDVVCKVCGKPLVEYYCDDDGTLNGIAHDHITKKVIEYLYWKRGMKPKVPVYQELQTMLLLGVDGDDTRICPYCGQVMHKHECFDRVYKYRFTCGNANCVPTTDAGVWYDVLNRVITSPLPLVGSKR